MIHNMPNQEPATDVFNNLSTNSKHAEKNTLQTEICDIGLKLFKSRTDEVYNK